MKPVRYHVHIVADDVDIQKKFSLSRITFWMIISVSIVFVTGFIFALWYYIPKISEFRNKESQYEQMLTERTQIMEMYKDLNRLGQMDKILRKNLSIPENLSQSTAMQNDTFSISYVENIPSFAPVDGFLTQRMITNAHILQKNHLGIDIAVKEGEAVFAAATGQVIFSGWTYDLGNLIIIYHGDDYMTYYGHNQLNMIQNHDPVNRGDLIALAGNTGISSGPHLHFEIWKGERVIDPLEFFPEYKEKNVSQDENG